MNSKIIISADCVCDLPETLAKKYSVHIVPFYIKIKEARFQDSTEINTSTLLECMEDDIVVSSTPASVDEYRTHFMNIKDSENTMIVHISLSKKLSDAYNNAFEAAKGIKNVFVVDSGSISCGMGIFVLTAADLAKCNATVEIILDELARMRGKISCSFVLKSSQYLANNSRASSTIANFLSIFRMKPIIKIWHNGLKVSGVCFGGETAYIRSYIRRILRNRKTISDELLFISLSGCSDDVQELIKAEVSKKINWKGIYVQNVSSPNLCNVGPGSIGIMFCKK